jgi:hypothetical protein
MAIQRVDLVRRLIMSLLRMLRGTVGNIAGNTEVVDRLTGPEGVARGERIADFICAELGDEDSLKRMGPALKAAAKAQAEPVIAKQAAGI